MNSAGLASEVDAFGECNMMAMSQRKLRRSDELKTRMTKIHKKVCVLNVRTPGRIVDSDETNDVGVLFCVFYQSRAGLNEICVKNDQLQLVQKYCIDEILFSLASMILNSLINVHKVDHP